MITLNEQIKSAITITEEQRRIIDTQMFTLIDFSQVFIASAMISASINGGELIEDECLTMAEASFGKYKRLFPHSESIFCVDNSNYWRKDQFEYYKIHRKPDKDKAKFDWNRLYELKDILLKNLREKENQIIIEIKKCEADDIIGAISINLCANKCKTDILIVSSDKDFQQLQFIPGLKQYAPVQDKFIECKNPFVFLKTHIIKGDRGDGIPNFLSPGDCFVTKTRQTAVMAKKLEKWIFQKPEEFCNENQLKRYTENRQLIDLRLIPFEYQKEIMNTFLDEITKASRSKENKEMNEYGI